MIQDLITSRRKIIPCLAFMVMVYIAHPANAANAGLLVSSWNFKNFVFVSLDNQYPSSTTNIGSGAPVPVTDTRYNAVGDTFALATYSFDWSGDTGSFRVDGQHQAVHPTALSLTAGTSGVVFFTPSVDSLVTLRVQYTYYLPGFMESFSTGNVFDSATNQLHAQISFGGFSVGPASGSFDETLTAIIPAGCQCEFGYTMRLTTYATSVPATDSGTVEMTITPVPEPNVLTPLALGALIFRRANRRIRQRDDRGKVCG